MAFIRETKRAGCKSCRADRVFFKRTRAKSVAFDWVCFTCRQPEAQS